MSLEHVFICNICREKTTNVNNVMGLKWTGSNEIDTETPAQANTHICVRCYVSMKQLMKTRHEKGLVP